MNGRLLILGLLLAGLAVPSASRAQPSGGALTELAVASVRSYAHYTIFDEVTIAERRGTITLGGNVTQPFKREVIATRVAAIDGVREVVNEIAVLPVSSADTRLRRAVAAAIYGHPTFWPYAAMASPPIHIVVARGRVRLTGEVASEVERRLAFALAHVDGASNIANELTIGR